MIIQDGHHAVTQRNRLQELYRKKAFCDLHLRSSDGILFRTHKLILATYSNYFRQFASRKKQSQFAAADVVNLDVESCILSELLDYIYRGKFEIQPETRVGIQKAAQTLELQDVLQLLDKDRESPQLATCSQRQTPSAAGKKTLTSSAAISGNSRKSNRKSGVDGGQKDKDETHNWSKQRRKSSVRRESRISASSGNEAQVGVSQRKRKSGVKGESRISGQTGDRTQGLVKVKKGKSWITDEERSIRDVNERPICDTDLDVSILDEPVVQIEMDICEDEGGQEEEVDDDKAAILKHLHTLPNNSVSDREGEMITELVTEYKPLEPKSEFMGIVQSIIKAAEDTLVSTSEHTTSDISMMKDSYNQNLSTLPMMRYDDESNNNDDDDDEYDPKDEIFMPIKTRQECSKWLHKPAISKKKPAKRKMPNFCKNLHVFDKVRSKEKGSNSTHSKQIVKKYHRFWSSRFALATSSVDSSTLDEDSEAPVSRSQKKHTCKICGRKFTLQSICKSHIYRKHLEQKHKYKQLSLKTRKPETTSNRKLRPRIDLIQAKSELVTHTDPGSVSMSASGSRSGSRSCPKSRSRIGKDKTTEVLFGKRTCAECGAVRCSRKSLMIHLRNFHKLSKEEAANHRSLKVKCEVKGCDFTALLTKDVEKHVKTVHPEVEHKCPLCNYTFFLSSVLDKHMHIKHYHPENLKYQCSVCGKGFNKQRLQKTHEQAKHGIDHGVNKYKCQEEDCDFSTASITTLKAHANVHKDKTFACPYCSMKLKTELNLQRHLNKIHLGIRPFLCQMCGQSFGDVHNLRAHIGNKHTADKEFKCPYCPYMTSNKAQHSMHVFLKHGIKIDKRKEFACPYCPYKALMKSRLEIHVNKHTNTRNYACDECGKTFVNCDTLRGHKEWLHSTAKYSCTHCHYVTKTDKRLQEHISIQHRFKGMKPYQCPYCPFTCATGGNTRKHVMKRHPGLEVKFLKNNEMINYMKEVKKKEASDVVSKTPDRLNVLM